MNGGDGRNYFGKGAGTGRGKGRMSGNLAGSGPGGDCICPSCGVKIPHQQGMPCYKMKCPECGFQMIRG